MSKPKKVSKGKHARDLGEETADPYPVMPRSREGKKRARQINAEEEFVDDKMSAKILKQAKQQQEEVEDEEWEKKHGYGGRGSAAMTTGRGFLASAAAAARAEAHGGDSDDEGGDGGDFDFSDDEDLFGGEEVEVSAEDEKALAAFMNLNNPFQTRNLADIIMSKIAEHEDGKEEVAMYDGTGPAPVPRGMDPKVVDVYTQVGALLGRYKSGKVPKAFKIIPKLTNWEEVLYLTRPEGWSPHAVYQATRLFASNLNARMAQRFYALVLLPRLRSDIEDNRRLHFALYQAVKKATYKPAAFYKGILLPLCASRSCTLREAVILSSILSKVSIPVLHSSAALLRMSEMEYAGTTSFFMRVLLDKKYALPYKVVDSLVDHFMRFMGDTRELPVVWHQSLLSFVAHYKNDIRDEDKDAIKRLMRQHAHYQVTRARNISQYIGLWGLVAHTAARAHR
eukprot:CAMPEP_0182865238 /NCGR_PEP_ID=MMETSP0034_2-20130328/7586_1 /TAXON_ID=156128 /ORGANISM="Nephroselmis pyriformis, Strain CCMP717" /LENGTH=451 /DNA_ID=CAMNT_0024997529 /DNA_START=48 /DNA_END=1400 /DNA_ORIENTATION=+